MRRPRRRRRPPGAAAFDPSGEGGAPAIGGGAPPDPGSLGAKGALYRLHVLAGPIPEALPAHMTAYMGQCPHDHARSEAARWIGGRAVASRHALPRARHARAALPLRPLAATVPPPSRERMAGWCPPRSSKPLCPWATLGRRVRFPCSPANHLGVLARSIRAERRTRIARGHRVAASSRTSAHPIAQDGVGPGGGPGESRSPVGPQDGTIHRGLPSASAGVEGDSGCGQLAPRALDGLSPR